MGGLKPLRHRGFGVFRWKSFQGEVETFSGQGGREFRVRWKQNRGRVEGKSCLGGNIFGADFSQVEQFAGQKIASGGKIFRVTRGIFG